jgi:peptidoglycan/LPS O-acetylase OafA/YrhL
MAKWYLWHSLIKHLMHSISTRFGVGGERRFAVLMIALSVAIFLAICRSERNAT